MVTHYIKDRIDKQIDMLSLAQFGSGALCGHGQPVHRLSATRIKEDVTCEYCKYILGKRKVKMHRCPSSAFHNGEPFVVGVIREDGIFGIEGAPDIFRAMNAVRIFVEHEERNGRDPNAIRIWRTEDIKWCN